MRLSDLLETNISQFGEYPLIHYKEKQYTNLECKMFASQFASGLHEHGITEGDRVIVCMPNCPEVIFAYQGITRAGAIIVPVMFTLHPKELHYIALNSGAKAVITSSLILGNVEKALEELPFQPLVVVVDQPSCEKRLNFYDVKSEFPLVSSCPGKENDTAVILYTSGTTGNPKGVLLTHKNLTSNAQNSVKHNELERGTTIGVLPLAHVYGLTISNICLLMGSSLVVFQILTAERY